MKNFRYSVERDYGHVIQHLESLPNTARIIDIGGGYNPWCKRFVTHYVCLLYTSPSPRDLSTSRMPSSA